MSKLLNKREVFEKVKTHLLTQMERSLSDISLEGSQVSTCMYRGDRGLQCAVGCLIPDELYDESMEAHPRDTGPTRDVMLSIGEGDCKILLSDLQTLHDNSEPSVWKAELDRIGRRLG